MFKTSAGVRRILSPPAVLAAPLSKEDDMTPVRMNFGTEILLAIILCVLLAIALPLP